MTHKLLLLIILTGFFSIADAYAQKSSGTHKLNATQLLLVKQIAEEGTVESQHIGIVGRTPNQWIRFDSLRKISTHEDLMSLANHKSAAVKIYIFDYLLDSHKWGEALQVLKLNYSDRTKFYQQSGCMILPLTVGFYMDFSLDSRLNKENIVLPVKSQQLIKSIHNKIDR